MTRVNPASVKQRPGFVTHCKPHAVAAQKTTVFAWIHGIASELVAAVHVPPNNLMRRGLSDFPGFCLFSSCRFGVRMGLAQVLNLLLDDADRAVRILCFEARDNVAMMTDDHLAVAKTKEHEVGGGLQTLSNACDARRQELVVGRLGK